MSGFTCPTCGAEVVQERDGMRMGNFVHAVSSDHELPMWRNETGSGQLIHGDAAEWTQAINDALRRVKP